MKTTGTRRTKEDQVVIVGGSFEVEPDQRDAFVAGRRDAIKAARAEAGCLEYAVTADPIEPGRAVLYERWADQAALDAHLAGMRQAPPPPPGAVTPKSATVVVYEISGERRLVG
jgi:quinol monooxygenase YgiN